MLGDLSITQIREIKQKVQNPRESDVFQNYAESLAEMERALAEAQREHQQALGLEPTVEEVDVEARKDTLLDFIEAQLGGDFVEFYFEHLAPADLDAEKAEPYLGLSTEEWEQQKATWAERYRETGGGDLGGYSDDELARLHVEDVFGVDLATFEREIVDWSKSETMRTALAGRFERVEASIHETTEAVEGGEAA